MLKKLSKKQGKSFEEYVKKRLKELEFYVVRLQDAPKPYSVPKASDFIAYKKPYLYLVECKETKKNRWNIKSNLMKNHGKNKSQFTDLLDGAKIDGIKSIIFLKFSSAKIILAIDINKLLCYINNGGKSITPINEEFIKIEKIKNKYNFERNDIWC